MRVNAYRKLNVITKYVYQTFNKNFLEMLELELSKNTQSYTSKILEYSGFIKNRFLYTRTIIMKNNEYM